MIGPLPINLYQHSLQTLVPMLSYFHPSLPPQDRSPPSNDALSQSPSCYRRAIIRRAATGCNAPGAMSMSAALRPMPVDRYTSLTLVHHTLRPFSDPAVHYLLRAALSTLDHPFHSMSLPRLGIPLP